MEVARITHELFEVGAADDSEATLSQFEKRALFRLRHSATARHSPNCFFEAFLRLGANDVADSIHFRQEAFELDTR
jgi:hypothetical protein